MANGDAAAAAGLAVFPATQDARLGYDNDNVRGDELAAHITSGGHPWSKITSKPGTFPPAAHNHDGSQITSGTLPSGRVVASRVSSDDGNVQLDINTLSGRVTTAQGRADAAYALAASAGGSAEADRVSAAAYGRTVSGGNFAMWMDADREIGRNVSSIRYKTDVSEYSLDPAAVLALRPVVYRRRDVDDAGLEYGLIAEDVAEHVPELVTYYDGEIDGVRYDLLAVALLDVMHDLSRRLRALEGEGA